MFDTYASLVTEQPPSCLMAGYVITGATAVKLTLKLRGIDPEEPRYAKCLPPPPGTHLIGDHDLIKSSIEEYMITSGLSDPGVNIALTGTDEEVNTIIVTQNCLLPHGFRGSRPEAKIGKREHCVRQWLERNGMPFLTSLLTFLTLPTGVDGGQYKWGLHEEVYD